MNIPDIQKHTSQDKILSKVLKYVLYGFPEKVEDFIKVYKVKNECISSENKCLFYANRVIIPEVLKEPILKSLHENHVGMVKMKMLARSYVWWVNIYKDIENYVKSCFACQSTLNVPKEVVTSKWEETSYPFERVHTDFFHLHGKTYLLYVDTYSKFCHVSFMNNTNAKNVNSQLSQIFSLLGLPTTIVSDNGPPYASHEFQNFLKQHNIKQMFSPPYHPQSNGSGERYVQTVKDTMKKYLINGDSLSVAQQLQKFHINYNNCPSTVTKKSPNELIFSFKPRIFLDTINFKTELNSKNKLNCKTDLKNFSNNNEVNAKTKYKN